MAGKTLTDRISEAQQEKQKGRWTPEEQRKWGFEGKTPEEQKKIDEERMGSGGGGEAKG